jgi:hypothetical protein
MLGNSAVGMWDSQLVIEMNNKGIEKLYHDISCLNVPAIVLHVM